MMTNWQELHADHFEGVPTLVTGGAGFIGSHLCEGLVKLGARVMALDDLSAGKRENLESLSHIGPGNLEFVEGSILDETALGRAMQGRRFVFHQGALPSVPLSIQAPRRFHEVNVTGTQIVLDTAVKCGVQRVMFAASSSAYGDSKTLPKLETMTPLPKSPYAANKLAGEHLMRAYASCFDLDTAVLRYFNIFGPRQNANSEYSGVIALFAKILINDGRPMIHGDGDQSRDFTFIDNVVHANLLAARCTKPLGGEVVNVACGRAVTINELATKMARALDKRQKVEHGPPRAGDVKHSLADLTRVRALIDYQPIVDFERGLEQTMDWYSSVMVGPSR